MSEDKYEVVRSVNGGCYLCSENGQELYLVRELSSERLTALCSCCLLNHLEDFMIDNTREWPFTKQENT